MAAPPPPLYPYKSWRRPAVVGSEQAPWQNSNSCPYPCPLQPLSHANFEATLARYPIVIVNFYAP